MKATLELSEGLVTANAPVHGHIDAAVSGDMAAVEFAVDHVRVVVGQHEDWPYRANPIAMLSMHPATMAQLALTMLEALGTPAFNEREWLQIADALAAVHASNLNEFVARIRGAYS